MLQAKHKTIFQKLMIGSMIMAMFGFGFLRWLRLEEAAHKQTKVTYDTNLHDQSANTKPVVVIPTAEKTDIKTISDKLLEASGYINNSDKEKSIEALEKAESLATEYAQDETNPGRETFKTVSERLVTIERDIKTDQRENAGREILELLKLLNIENQKSGKE